MRRFRLSPQAAQDLREIWSYIADDSLKAARRVRLRLFDACKLLAKNPSLGHERRDITDLPVLFWPVGSYVIIYRPQTKPLEIIRVIHGARDMTTIFPN